ncbi:MAG: hypothetical protein KBT47_04310, partial [Armatimonadetes bacterium]|nr:hypothetical protein [Candidatus Hippobium faecium]
VFVGCRDKEIPEPVNTVEGTAHIRYSSDYLVKFENIWVGDEFKKCVFHVEDSQGNTVREELDIEFSRPVCHIFQRDFDGDGRDELLISSEPYGENLYYDFGVYELSEDWVSEEVFCGDGSLVRCDYWFLGEDNRLFHLCALRNYEKPENAVYKSRYICTFLKPEAENNKLTFVSCGVKKTFKEMDNLKEIKKEIKIPENAALVSETEEP